MLSIKRYLLLTLLSYTAIASCTLHAESESDLISKTAKVWYIADGDTIDVVFDGDAFLAENAERIRITGINAMEVGKESGNQDNCHGDEAETRITQLLGGGSAIGATVTLKTLDLNAESRGRMLRYVFFDNGAGEFDVGKKLIEEGLVLAFPHLTEVVYNNDYLIAQQTAETNGTNIWNENDCAVGPESTADFDIYVNYDADGDDTVNLNGEYVVIMNNSNFTVELEDWIVRDSGLDFYRFSAGDAIAGNSSITLYIGSGTNTNTKFYWGLTEPIFQNKVGDAVYLLDPDTDEDTSDNIYPMGDIRAHFTYPCVVNCSSSLSGAIEISTIYDPDGDDNLNLNGEVVYISNTSGSTVDISRTRVTSDPIGSASYIFADGTTIATGEKISLYIGSGTDTATEKYWGKSVSILDNEADKVALSTLDQIEIDSFSWPCVSNCNSELTGKVELTAFFDADGDDNLNLNGEVIFITNITGNTIDLSQTMVTSDPAGSASYFFADGTTIAAGDKLSLYIGSGTDTTTKKYWGNSVSILDNETDKVTLSTLDQIKIDSFEWPCVSNCTSDLTGKVKLTAIFDADGNDNLNLNGEIVFITNTSANTIDLSQTMVTSDPTGSASYYFADGTTIAAGKKLSLYIGSGTDSTSKKYWGNSVSILANDKDKVTLSTLDQIKIDSFEWPCVLNCTSELSGKVELLAIYDPDGVDDDNLNKEKVYITNISNGTIDLADLLLASAPSGSATHFFSQQTNLGAGERLELRIGSGTDSRLIKHWGNTSSILANSSDAVTLKTLDQVQIKEFKWPCLTSCSHPLKNKIALSANYDAAGDDNSNVNGEWVVIENISNASINLKDTLLKTDSPGVLTYQFSSNTNISPGERIRVYVGIGSETSSKKYWGQSNSILNNTDDGVSLTSFDAIVIAKHTWPCSSSGCQSGYGVEIKDVNYDAPGSDATNPNGEHFKIQNISASTINLRDWKLTIRHNYYDFSKDFSLAPGAQMTVFIGSGTDTSSTIYLGYSSGILSNGGDSIQIYSQFRDLLDCVDWGTLEGSCKATVGADSDKDGVINSRDFNSDNDTIADYIENQLGSSTSTVTIASELEGSALGSSIATCDFNNDGKDDIALGAPKANHPESGLTQDGAVKIIYGGNSTADFSVEWLHQGMEGLSINPLSTDLFGTSITAIDFNLDDYCDLAIGIPQSNPSNISNAGSVLILYGSSNGLTTLDNQLITEAGGYPGTKEAGDRFGNRLVSGDFNGDLYGDLIVGSPKENIGSRIDAGAITVIYGSPSGLGTGSSKSWYQGKESIPGSPENYDYFGESLAVGDFNGDDYDDVIIGAKGEDIGGKKNVGLVISLYGSASGLTSSGSQTRHENTSGIKGINKAYDYFGLGLSAADFDNDGFDDMAIGIPRQEVGSITNAGRVLINFGSSTGLTGRDQVFDLNTSGIKGVAGSSDFLGNSLVAGHLDGDNYADLAISIPYDNVGATDSGTALILFGGSNGLTKRDLNYNQGDGTVGGAKEAYDNFGSQLGIADIDGDGHNELVVTSPGEDLDDQTFNDVNQPIIMDFGSVNILTGQANGPGQEFE